MTGTVQRSSRGISAIAAADWLEAQLELINQIGDQNYLAQQLHS
jgi:hypothetical protein